MSKKNIWADKAKAKKIVQKFWPRLKIDNFIILATTENDVHWYDYKESRTEAVGMLRIIENTYTSSHGYQNRHKGE